MVNKLLPWNSSSSNYNLAKSPFSPASFLVENSSEILRRWRKSCKVQKNLPTKMYVLCQGDLSLWFMSEECPGLQDPWTVLKWFSWLVITVCVEDLAHDEVRPPASEMVRTNMGIITGKVDQCQVILKHNNSLICAYELVCTAHIYVQMWCMRFH